MTKENRSVVARGYGWGRGRLPSGSPREFSGGEKAVLGLVCGGGYTT